MGYTSEMKWSNGSVTVFSLCIRISAEKDLTAIHFVKLCPYIRLFHCDGIEAFVSAKNANILTQSIGLVDSNGYIFRCRLMMAFCL